MPVIQFTLLCTCVHRDELIIEMTRPIKWHGLQQTADRVLGPVVELGVPERRWSEHQVGDSWQRIAEAAHPTPGYRNTVLLNGQTPTGEHLMSDEDVGRCEAAALGRACASAHRSGEVASAPLEKLPSLVAASCP